MSAPPSGEIEIKNETEKFKKMMEEKLRRRFDRYLDAVLHSDGYVVRAQVEVDRGRGSARAVIAIGGLSTCSITNVFQDPLEDAADKMAAALAAPLWDHLMRIP